MNILRYISYSTHIVVEVDSAVRPSVLLALSATATPPALFNVAFGNHKCKHVRVSSARKENVRGVSAGTRHATRDGTGVRDYVHVWDVARAHLLALSATANPPALFNVASGKGVSVREFVEACIKVTGVKFKVVEVVEARPGDCAEVRVCSSCFFFSEYLDVRVVGFWPTRPGVCAHVWVSPPVHTPAGLQALCSGHVRALRELCLGYCWIRSRLLKCASLIRGC